jgi:hypothetical protein
MKIRSTLPVLAFLLLFSCIRIEEEPILLINPTADISAHIKKQKIYATVLVNVNPEVLTPGNIPIIFDFSGELAIYNTATGNEIDVKAFSGGGLSQVYTVSADTTEQERFVVIVSGKIDAFADIGNDEDASNDKLISSGHFYREQQFIVSDLLQLSPQ